ncbi:hypothetical protein EVAR_59087_1 [Eumeta japonica]|uniref:Secreted protein n=1 Tax=Eumeta variegata TaxID=151549 RepID=A0A4C1YZM9_EUMVA|nr:hypothetical protein EVAR_59087_1 [Eumeta japonica]
MAAVTLLLHVPTSLFSRCFCDNVNSTRRPPGHHCGGFERCETHRTKVSGSGISGMAIENDAKKKSRTAIRGEIENGTGVEAERY